MNSHKNAFYVYKIFFLNALYVEHPSFTGNIYNLVLLLQATSASFFHVGNIFPVPKHLGEKSTWNSWTVSEKGHKVAKYANKDLS